MESYITNRLSNINDTPKECNMNSISVIIMYFSPPVKIYILQTKLAWEGIKGRVPGSLPKPLPVNLIFNEISPQRKGLLILFALFLLLILHSFRVDLYNNINGYLNQ
jgi:hypothetical protein